MKARGDLMNIRPSAAIRQNYNEIADLCRKSSEPVFLTKNGEGDLVVMAVLEKKVGLHLASSDAYVNIAGGMKMTEPAIDLGICLAIASSMKDIVIPDKLMAFGEIGLSGEVRAVSMAGQRVQEAKKLGFDTVILPEVCRSSVEKADGIKLVYVRQIQDAIRYIMSK